MPNCIKCGSPYDVGDEMCYYCGTPIAVEQTTESVSDNGRYVITCPLCAVTYEVDSSDSRIHKCGECGCNLSKIEAVWEVYEVVTEKKNILMLVRRADKKEYLISDDEPVILGRRGSEMFLDVFSDDCYSREECEISCANGRWQICVLNTHGHVLINGNEIPNDGRKRMLKSGDILTVYDRRFNVVI